ncbi:MAG: response regulator transcription factor [Sphaerochaetaceae bacterium]|nr:response regulator transcription factor [Sphaerochaetaceae bacterium]MDC7247079.1 response regulator transcription factor [Sphaerochaetaceae bacterium]
MKHIFVVEDHNSIRESVVQYLELYGYKVSQFTMLNEVTATMGHTVPDLLIQDVMLPDGDGFAFVKQIRTQYSFPVIFMTARGTESDRILGFEIGGDDYIVKPFSPKELVLRVNAIFRRMDSSTHDREKHQSYWRIGDSILLYDEYSHILKLNGTEISLTTAEWRIMSHLVGSAGNLVTRTQILESCFEYSFESYDRVVDTHIKNIRKKLNPRGSDWIETIRGYGYRFAGEQMQGPSL